MARTRYQKPSLKKDVAHHRFEARFREDEIQKDGTIKRIRRKVHFSFLEYPTLKLAQKALDEILTPINKPSYKPKRVTTFAEFADTWMSTILVQKAVHTQELDKRNLTKFLIPVFGHLKIGNIDTEVVQKWVTANTTELSAAYLHNIYATLRKMLQIAKRDKYIESNPCCRDIVLPRKPEAGENTYAYTLDDYQAMRQYLNEQDRLIFRLQAETGIRPGERSALKVECLSLHNGTPMLAINENYVSRQGGSFKRPKNNKRRSFPISMSLYQDLRQFLNINNRAEGLIFRTQNNRPIDVNNWNKMIREAARKAGVLAKIRAMGINRLGSYPLRRLVSTEADGQHLPEKTREKRMGHNKNMFGTYAKAIEEADIKFANSMAAKLDDKGAQAAKAVPSMVEFLKQFGQFTPEAQEVIKQALKSDPNSEMAKELDILDSSWTPKLVN